MAEKEVKLRKDGLPKQPLNAFEKIVIVISVVLILATAVCGTFKYAFYKMEGIKDVITSSVLKKDEGESKQIDKRVLKLANMFMPDSIELENGDGIKFNVRVEFNENFDSKQVDKLLDYLNIMNLYDWEGNPVSNEDKIQKFGIQGQQLKIMALMKIADKLVDVKKTVNNVFIFLIMGDIAAGIFIAYFIWRRADDRRELREAQLREAEKQHVRGLTDEEITEVKKQKKKKKKK